MYIDIFLLLHENDRFIFEIGHETVVPEVVRSDVPVTGLNVEQIVDF